LNITKLIADTIHKFDVCYKNI